MGAVAVQHASGQATALSVTVTLGAAPTAGNVILAFVKANGAAASPSPATGWTQDLTDGGTQFEAIWRRVVQTGENAAYTFTQGVSAVIGLHLLEVSGLDTLSLLDAVGGPLTFAGSTSTSPSVTSSAGDRILFGGAGLGASSGGFSAPSNSFLQAEAQGNTQSVYRILTATGVPVSSTLSWLTARSGASMLASYNVAVTPPPTPPSGPPPGDPEDEDLERRLALLQAEAQALDIDVVILQQGRYPR